MLGNRKMQLGVVSLLALVVLVGSALVPAAAAFAAEKGAPSGARYDVGALSDDEIAGLLYMREEEKLARDVYLTLYDAWGLRVFQNIARAEQIHMDAVLTLIARYGLDDPVTDDTIGVFTNADLQALYAQLVAQGSESLEAALRVGATIEEIDIQDLEAYLATTDAADIRLAYENLKAGSYNHLRAFVSTLEAQTGETYQPQYLAQSEYEAIMAGQTARVGQGRGVYGAQSTYGQGAVGRGAGGRGRGHGGHGMYGQSAVGGNYAP